MATLKQGNWIEKATGKKLAWWPIYIGQKGVRALYAVTFEDGTEIDFYIDFEDRTIEAY